MADQLYWQGAEGNLAIQIEAKFDSREEMTEMLALDRHVGEWQGATWVLAEILVSVDLNGNGDVAGWVVSGPKPLIQGYVQGLRNLYAQSKVFYDFWAGEIEVKPYASWEGEVK